MAETSKTPSLEYLCVLIGEFIVHLDISGLKIQFLQYSNLSQDRWMGFIEGLRGHST